MSPLHLPRFLGRSFGALAVVGSLLFLAATGRAAMPVTQFAQAPASSLRGGAILDPTRFFLGRGHSWGVFENRAGEPTRRFAVVNRGHWEGQQFILRQDFTFEDRSRQTRQWEITRVDAHHYVGRAPDVAGEARGEAFGNAFRWEYTLRLPGHGPIRTVRLRQWLYLQEDGRALYQHAVIKKFGLTVAQVTEWITRDH